MKINLSCEEYKPTTKSGQKEKCHCKYLNRNFNRNMKIYNMFMKTVEKPSKKK